MFFFAVCLFCFLYPGRPSRLALAHALDINQSDVVDYLERKDDGNNKLFLFTEVRLDYGPAASEEGN